MIEPAGAAAGAARPAAADLACRSREERGPRAPPPRPHLGRGARRLVEKYLDDAFLAGLARSGSSTARARARCGAPWRSSCAGIPWSAASALAEPRRAARASRVALEGADASEGLARRRGGAARPEGEPMRVPPRPRRDPGARGSRRARRRGRAAQARRRRLEGPLPVPPGEDAVVHRPPEVGHLPLLRLRRGRRRLRLPACATTGSASPRRCARSPSARASSSPGASRRPRARAARRGAPPAHGAGRGGSYVAALWGREAERARAYLDARGIEPEVARRFGLG